MRLFFKLIGAALLVLIAVLAYNTASYKPIKTEVATITPIAVDGDAMAQLMSQAVRFKTISFDNSSDADPVQFSEFVAWLAAVFPAAHGAMELTLINDLTPLYRWQGRDTETKPVLLTAHYDVVPVGEDAANVWDHPPFAGVIADGFVHGRGTLDDKGSIVTMMQAVETLVRDGFQPNQTVYFAFGHDEEIGGEDGAGAVVSHLRTQGITLDWSLDEGSMLLDGIVPGIDKPIASINVAEKGYVTVDITAKGEGGHSSMPPRETAVGALAKGIARLQDAPVPGGLTGMTKDMFDGMAPHFGLLERVLFANQWLFRPLLESQLSKAVTTDAVMRSTMAPTMLQASNKENVLAQSATATVNYRIHPRDTIAGLIQHTHDHLHNDDLKVTPRPGAREASRISDAAAPAFLRIATSVQQVFGDVAIVAGLTIAATDSRHYETISDNSYRILPFIFGPQDVPRIHGKNERISIENLVAGTQFYAALLADL